MAERVLKNYHMEMEISSEGKQDLQHPPRRVLIQTDFDCACCAWYPNLPMLLKDNCKHLRTFA